MLSTNKDTAGGKIIKFLSGIKREKQQQSVYRAGAAGDNLETEQSQRDLSSGDLTDGMKNKLVVLSSCLF